MIFICEPQCVGFEHSEFNAALIARIVQRNPLEKVKFFAERDHLKLVRDRLKEKSISNVDFECISLPSRNQKYNKIYGELILCYKIYGNANKNQCTKVFFSSITKSCLLAIKFLQVYYRNINSFIIPHAILEEIEKKPQNIFKRIFWFKNCLNFFNNNRTKYVILGESIKQELLNILPKIKKYLIVINLPYFFENNVTITNQIKSKIKFGVLGVGHKEKGTHLMFQLADKLNENKFSKDFEFLLIGHITDDSIRNLKSEKVIIPSPDDPLTKEYYNSLILEVDYIVFFYDANSYRLRASATFFDALSFGKPIISMKNPFIEYYFRLIGEIGYLCEDLSEMHDQIAKLLNNEHSNIYNLQVNNILNKREKIENDLGTYLK